MKRRSFIATAASCGVAGLSGCSSLTMDSFDLQLVNQRENSVEVNVVIASADYEDTFQVAGNSGSVTREGVAPPKEQEITVTTAECSKTEQISPQGCREPLVVVTIHDGCEVEFGGKKC